MRDFEPREVIVEAGSEASPIYRNLKRALPDVPFVYPVPQNAPHVSAGMNPERVRLARKRGSFRVDVPGVSPWYGVYVADVGSAFSASGDGFGEHRQRLFLTRHKGDFLKKCPGSDGQVCCNYFVVNFASNCPMECSYCYLQEYLADNPALKVFSNVDDLVAEAHALFSRHRGFFFRIGTGEITDSLALDPYIGFSREVVPFFAEQPNVLLELKTKSDCVEDLIGLDPKGRVVVSWSMNPQRVIDADEHLTASLEERLAAAKRCQEAGYKLGFHFDPIIEYPGWEEDYRAMVEGIFTVVDHRRVAWLSMGVLRQTPGLKRLMRRRFPSTQILSGEQVLCPDGKMRYFQPLRVSMYRKMLGWIREASPTVFVYLCMESREVWEQVFGFAPSCEKELGNRLVAYE